MGYGLRVLKNVTITTLSLEMAVVLLVSLRAAIIALEEI